MNKVIACIDGSRSSLSVCDYAAWASRRMSSPLTLLHVIHNPHADAQRDLSGNLSLGGREALLEQMVEAEEQRGKLLREQGRAILHDALERVRANGVADPGSLLRNDGVTAALDDIQEEARLVVVGKQGKDGDMLKQHVGSHLESIIRTLKRGVLVAPLEYREPERFLIAYDGSATAHTVVEKVSESPLLKGLEAHILMVGDDNQENRSRLDNARGMLAQNGFDVRAQIRTGDVAEAVCAYRQEHDIHLLAMGAYGHSRLRRWFVGSTTTNMIMRSPIPLIILR
ncbi:universal stress protein [Ectothiorhodospira haloalkaliphila]|uniref:universal stress protein n=1 Tax=Ectothiorhodospira haloalkaliphila TaxID=421628 RepID=UPI001EE96BEE|nr:universal stress protein [Ectothiorhodospira haloalkaliphila]MCG5524753.1 universal stress protein [Ectothiorhodospira haloalkaliphila]